MTPKISLDSPVQIQKDVVFQQLEGEGVLLNLNTGVYLGLDPISTRIWQLLEQQQSLRGVMDVMLQEYEVTEDKLAMDLLNLIGQMEKQGLVAVTP